MGIISTGNEVIALDKTLRPGKIYDSNRYMLEAAVMQLGMVPVHLGLIGDDADGIARLIEKGLARLRCDPAYGRRIRGRL